MHLFSEMGSGTASWRLCQSFVPQSFRNPGAAGSIA